ncbi:MAG: hypothetical protein PHN84_03285 [Desulfuromonadaceae bacterium]|nr:hypothetical protein [Desulfuromonadaceae bacterium]
MQLISNKNMLVDGIHVAIGEKFATDDKTAVRLISTGKATLADDEEKHQAKPKGKK